MADFRPLYPEKVEDESIKNALLALRKVIDPEIGLNIVDLGLIYDLKIDKENKRAEVSMTLTVPGCPLSAWLVEQARLALLSLPDIEDADIKLVFDPPWSPDFVNREALGLR